MTHSSRIDASTGIALGWLVLAVPACLAVGLFTLSSPSTALIFFGCAAGLAALLYAVCWPVRYTLGERELIIQFGALRTRIPYAEIEEVYPTRSTVAAPALSRDRLAIKYRGGHQALVSPRDRQSFLRDLLAHGRGGLVVSGEIVTRR
jgi:hypothetical protein